MSSHCFVLIGRSLPYAFLTFDRDLRQELAQVVQPDRRAHKRRKAVGLLEKQLYRRPHQPSVLVVQQEELCRQIIDRGRLRAAPWLHSRQGRAIRIEFKRDDCLGLHTVDVLEFDLQ